MKKALENYSPDWPSCQWPFVYLLAWALILSSEIPASELLVSSGSGRAGPLSWFAAEIDYQRNDQAEPAWTVTLAGVKVRLGDASELAIDQVVIVCPSGQAMDPALPNCRNGELTWRLPSGGSGRADLALVDAGSALRFELTLPAVRIDGTWSWKQSRLAQLEAGIDTMALAPFKELLSPWVELDYLAGQISGQMTLEGDSLRGEWRIQQLGFDGNQGQVAGDSVDLALLVSGELGAESQALELQIQQVDGELLFGPLYLSTPAEPIEVGLSLLIEPERLTLERLRYEHSGVVEFEASALLVMQNALWSLSTAHLSMLEANLARAWPRWAEGLAASAGFGGLEAAGRLSATGRASATGIEQLDARIEGLELRDPQARFALQSTDGTLQLGEQQARLALDLNGLALYGLPFGSGRIRARRDPAADRSGWRLHEPLRLPLLDGAIWIDRFELDEQEGAPGIVLDASIEPLSLEALTETLNWPRFGGQLSGRFPGIEFRADRLNFTGGLTVDAFSGRIQLSELVVERPFGTLPALAAQVDIERLDLLELTGAFNFGRMEGALSGQMRDLRLLDWQPVAMDTRLHTHEDAPRRRISQRAVDNLSNLGGSLGGALINNTVLSVFEDFPYRRAGLSCRLSNNICYVGGVAEHESGGFYIVEGRLLPRLDIIGHRRLVDWPQLIGQLRAATR